MLIGARAPGAGPLRLAFAALLVGAPTLVRATPALAAPCGSGATPHTGSLAATGAPVIWLVVAGGVAVVVGVALLLGSRRCIRSSTGAVVLAIVLASAVVAARPTRAGASPVVGDPCAPGIEPSSGQGTDPSTAAPVGVPEARSPVLVAIGGAGVVGAVVIVRGRRRSRPRR